MTTTSPVAVLVSHGDRAGESPNAALRMQIKAVRALSGCQLVTGGCLKGDPTLEEALAVAANTAAQEILIYPLFMADGYFVRKVLPERISAAGHAGRARILAPLGLDPRLPTLMVRDATAACRDLNCLHHETRLLVVGHGSKIGPASADATRLLATKIQSLAAFGSVETAFLEEAPFVSEALAATATPTIVAGYFFGDGLHAGEDVPKAIAETGARATYTGPIGNSAGISSLIAASLAAA